MLDPCLTTPNHRSLLPIRVIFHQLTLYKCVSCCNIPLCTVSTFCAQLTWYGVMGFRISSGDGLSSNCQKAITLINDSMVPLGRDKWFQPWNPTEYLIFQMSESYLDFIELKL